MPRQQLIDLMSVILVLIMLVMLGVSWQFLGVAVQERPIFARIYRVLSLIFTALFVSAVILFFLIGPGLGIVGDLF